MTTEGERPPSRLVDGKQRSWMNVNGPGDGGPWYTADMHRTHATLAEVLAGPPPVREVLPITTADRARLREAITLAGRRGATTIASALYRTYQGLLDRRGVHIPIRGPEGMEGSERAVQQMIAGRPGSWESVRLIELMWWGAGLKESRVDEAARDPLVDLFTGWVDGPERYTEVAETLAAEVSVLADEMGGWDKVADQWIRPGALDTEGVFLTHGLLYSTSPHFEPA